MNKQDYIKLVNQARKENKNKWVSFTTKVENISIGIKFYNTWIQIIEFNDGLTSFKDNSNMDISVKQFNDFLENSVTNALTRLQ